MVSSQERESYRKECLGSKPSNKTSNIRLFNSAVIAWLEGRQEPSLDTLRKLKSEGFEVAEIALALSDKSPERREQLLRKLDVKGVQFANVELAMNVPITKRSRRYVSRILSSVATRGDSEAALRLAIMHLNGKSGPVNIQKGDFYLDFASLSKNPEYVFIVALTYSNYPALKNRAKFLEYLIRAASLGHEEALRIIADAVIAEEIAADIRHKTIQLLCDINKTSIILNKKEYSSKLSNICGLK